MSQLKKSQEGFLMIAAMVLIVIFGVIGVVATRLVNSDILSGTSHLRSDQALYNAEGGLEVALRQLVMPTISARLACANMTGNATVTNVTFSGAAGPFTVTAALQSPTVSTLSGAITASALTIPVVNAATYATAGRIMIDGELINYSTVSGNNFINVQRGADGTVAVSHASGTLVGQYQCRLRSSGGVPNLSPTGNLIAAGRTVQEAVQLPQAWAGGDGSTLINWNAPSELQWNIASVSGTNNINSVFMLSYADAWAVGQEGSIFHWSGSSWATSASGTTSNFLSVYCLAGNNCWAVGAGRTFDFWNGSTWALQNTTVSTLPATSSYNAVYCNATNDCWAVGNMNASQELYAHWDGTSWTRDVSAPSAPQNLNDVVCTASNNCWAVGASRTVSFWNGSAWAHVSNTSFPNVTLNSVDCTSSNNCWIAGNFINGGNSTLMYWNGSTWTQDHSSQDNLDLYSVRCHGANNCWAVGQMSATLYWNGSVWNSIANPLGNTILRSVSVVGGNTKPISGWQEIFPSGVQHDD